MKIHILFEHGSDNRPFGSASIRLLRPFSHPRLGNQIDVTTGITFAGQKVDIVIVDRLWQPELTLETAQNLERKIRQAGAKLVYALDDSFLDIPGENDIHLSEEKIRVFQFLLQKADCIWVSTPLLRERLLGYNRNIIVLPHALDERLLFPHLIQKTSPWKGNRPFVIGYMGTFTHDNDLRMILPALRTVWENHPEEIEFQIVGCIGDPSTKELLEDLPVRYISTEPGEEEYPLFMLWFTSQIDWDIAIAPLQDTEFNRVKSDIKFLDYSAMGVAGVFSDSPAYRSSIVHMHNGLLAANQTQDWVECIELLLRDDALRTRIARTAYHEVHTQRTLDCCIEQWLQAVEFTLREPEAQVGQAVSIVIPTKNAEPYIGDLLQSIFDQQTIHDFEVKIVDSGSKDRTLDICSSFPLHITQIQPATFNHGLTRNLGVTEARDTSEFIVFLSQDAKPYNPDWLQNLIQPFLADDQVAGVFSRHVPRPGACASLVRQLTQLTQSGGDQRLFKKLPDSAEAFETQRFYLNFFSNTSSAVRRKVWEEIPFEQVDFAEDALWADRVIQNGYTIVFEPASVVVHSHNYSIVEQFRQNVDHTYGFEQLFSPQVFHDNRIWLKQFLGIPLQVIEDCKFVIKSPYFSNRSICYKLYMVLLSVPWQFATVLGAWVGANFRSMPEWMKKRVSRQTRIKLQ